MEINLTSLLSPTAALVAGFLTSLHCVGMCTPLACLILKPKNARPGLSSVLPYGIYHAGRLVSYGVIGIFAGMLGARLVDWVGQRPAHILPWVFAAFFALVAVGLDKRLFRHGAFGATGRRVMKAALSLRGETRALALGLATPLLPCGPLYLFFWVAAASGSAVNGGIALAAFGLGTIPAMAASYFGWGYLQDRLKGESVVWTRRGLAALVVVVLVARGFVDLDFDAVTSLEICQ